MIVSIASDHAGYALRQKIVSHLKEKGFEVLEGGATSSSESYSYVKAGQKVARDVNDGTALRGIVICGTGIGISIVANKYKGIRCALCTNEFMARMSREHNDANVLALGERVIGYGVALSTVDAFLEEEFLGERHAIRVNDIKEQEDELFK